MQDRTEVTSSSRWWRRGATTVFIAGMAALIVLNLPPGFDTDLSKIGAGKPALVFVYDPNLVVSNKQTAEMDRARQILADELHFLIADVGRPDAQQFMQQYKATPTQLLLFAADGDLLSRSKSLATADQLLTKFNAALGSQ